MVFIYLRYSSRKDALYNRRCVVLNKDFVTETQRNNYGKYNFYVFLHLQRVDDNASSESDSVPQTLK